MPGVQFCDLGRDHRQAVWLVPVSLEVVVVVVRLRRPIRGTRLDGRHDPQVVDSLLHEFPDCRTRFGVLFQRVRKDSGAVLRAHVWSLAVKLRGVVDGEEDLQQLAVADLRRDRLRTQFTTLLPRVAQMIDQTTRRVVHGEAVPADEKLVSLFEAHTDVLVKDRRETHYGHKIFLTTGRSGLILDCAIPKGNPGDVTWTMPLVRRQERLFGSVPRHVSMDGAFASKENLADLKAGGVTDVCFAKKRGLAVVDMTRSQWVYDKLRRFRAGIESGISLLKRVFGLARCVWKGPAAFHAYVRTAVFAANLLLLARARLP